MKKAIIWIVSILVLVLLILFGFVQLTWDKQYEAPFPEVSISTDSSVLARGKYIAFGPGHCGTCHVPMDKIVEVENGLEIPLSGGWELPIPPGVFRAPNITPDETGIGKYSDEEIARVLRHSVAPDGRIVFPFMPFQNLSDEDLSAVISFLRSQDAVNNSVPKTELNFMGKAIAAFGMMKPIGPDGTPPKSIEKAATIEYGSYIANSVANCFGCHTQRDLKTGAFIGPDYGGGFVFAPDAFTNGYSFVSPNLTPHKGTGIMSEWTEEMFLERFRSGRTQQYSPMPWGAYSRMEEVELRAVYKYLRSLDPVENLVARTVYEPGEEILE